VIIQCTSCRARYHYDESRFAGAPAKRIKCTKCATVFEIQNPAMAVPEPFRTARGGSIGPDEFSLDETALTEASKRRTAGAPMPGAPSRTNMLESLPPGQTAGPAESRAAAPAPGAPTTDRVPVAANPRPSGARPLRLPEGVRLSLACISGPDSGRIFEIDRPRVVIGRANADIVVSDIQCSRQHAAIEVQDEHVFLVDLGSTNGTYVHDQRVGRAELESRTEFEIGTTTLMLIRSGGPHDSPGPS
jgi:predicted Zn finger-like uncharacterized protein